MVKAGTTAASADKVLEFFDNQQKEMATAGLRAAELRQSAIAQAMYRRPPAHTVITELGLQA